MSVKSDIFVSSSSNGKVELPRAFVNSLKILFDILDEDNDGFVPVNEIESRWQGEGINGLPTGVLESLRQVVPKNGRLTFELFCAALKLTLQKNKEKGKEEKQPNKAAVRPNNVHPMRPSQSAPALRGGLGWKNKDRAPSASDNDTLKSDKLQPPLFKDKNEPIYRRKTENGRDEQLRRGRHSVGDKVEISAELKNWQNERRGKNYVSPGERPPSRTNGHAVSPGSLQVSPNSRANYQDVKIYESVNRQMKIAPSKQQVQNKAKTQLIYPQESNHEKQTPPLSANNNNNQRPRVTISESLPLPTNKKASSKRREEPRRHTLSNGVDFNALKRLKQLEQEKDILCQGLEIISRAQEWYRQKILELKEKQEGLGNNSQDSGSQKHEDHRVFRIARIQDVNRQLEGLMKINKDFPDHMNLALPTKAQPTDMRDSPLVAKLKDQNKQLTKEVSTKSEKITVLENEKAALIRQMFEAKGKQQKREKAADNSVFL